MARSSSLMVVVKSGGIAAVVVDGELVGKYPDGLAGAAVGVGIVDDGVLSNGSLREKSANCAAYSI